MRSVLNSEAFADHLIDQLDAIGLVAHRDFTSPGEANDSGIDFILQIEIEGQFWRLLVEAKSKAPSPADLARVVRTHEAVSRPRDRATYCLLAPRLLNRHRSFLRDAGISHGDLTGVLYLRAPGLLIDVGSNRKPSELDELRRAGLRTASAPDIFSDRSSLVLRALSMMPAAPQRVTRISELTGVSPGWISRVASELRARGYAQLTSKGLVLSDPVSMLREWVGRYEWKSNHVRRFHVPHDAEHIVRRMFSREVSLHPQAECLLTLHSGAKLFVRHVETDVVTAYTPGPAAARRASLVLEQLSAYPTPTGGNLQLVTPFYEHSVGFGGATVGGQRVVSLVQLYLDLARYPLRGPEAASTLVKGPLGDQLGLSGSQRKQLLDLTA